MKDILQKKIRELSRPEQKYNALREGLQHLILKVLDEGGYFKTLCFMGGTSLRIIYDLRRFSEDLDFSLQKPDDSRFDFQKMLGFLKNQLALYGLYVDTKVKETGNVKNVFLRFKDILQEFGVSRRQGQKLSIKLEVDIHPPAFAHLESHLIQKDYLFTVVHHDLPTLLSGKILAFLFRNYTKGRDLYDLLWFLTRKTPANKAYLQSGFEQASGQKTPVSHEELVKKLIQKLENTSMPTVMNDVRPFLDDPGETRLFDKTLLKDLIQGIQFES